MNPTIWSFKIASSEQFLPILNLYRACGKEMLAQGFANWGDFYPTETQIRFDLEHQHLYGLYDENQALAAVAVLDELYPNAYQNIEWIYPSQRPFYLHRLAVNPQLWGKSLGKIIMGRIEQQAIALKGDALRLDALQINKRLIHFYENLGYAQQGQLVWHGDAWPHPFLCFEKNLSL